MNILYIEHYAGSLEMGMEFRPYYFSREWVKMGHKVRILAADYSHLRRKNPVIKNDFEIQMIDGIEYQWFKSKTYEGNGVKRALTMFSFVGKLKRGAKRIVNEFHPDVVITSSTYPLDCDAGIKIAKIAKCRYVHEVHDIWPLTLTEIGGMGKHNPFVMILAKAEKKAYNKSEAIVSVLPYTNEHIKEIGINADDKYTYIPNGISLDDWKDVLPLPEEHKALFDKLHKKNKFVIEYVGGHALSNNLDVMLDAADKTREDKSLAYVLVGKGVEKDRLMKKASELGLDNLYFLPPVEKKAIPSVLDNADALFICSKKSSLYRYGISMNKVYDYMMSAKPILYGIDAKNNDVLDAKCGLYFEPEDINELVKQINTLKSMSKEELKKMGENGHKWVLENCSYTELAKEFLEILKGGKDNGKD